MISSSAFHYLWSQYEGRILICNTVCQIESGVLSEETSGNILREFDRCDKTVPQICGLIPDKLWFASELTPHVDHATRLIRVAPLGAILAGVDKSLSGEVRLIEAELNRFKPRVDAAPNNLDLLDEYEQELHELFDTAADEQRRAGIAVFSHGEMSWLNVNFSTNVKLSSTAAGNPTFCTTSSARHREAEIFTNRAGAADRARNILGLASFDNTRNNSVVTFGAMAFSWEDLEGMPVLARPSVADLIDQKRFKGVFGDLAGATDYWGRALDLATMENGRPHRGGREVVVAASRPTTLHIAFLGYLRLPRGDVYNNPECDIRFEELCLRGRTKDDFMSIVCS